MEISLVAKVMVSFSKVLIIPTMRQRRVGDRRGMVRHLHRDFSPVMARSRFSQAAHLVEIPVHLDPDM
ncbi:MAG: hypothetical protein COB40_12530 [Marinosulfonomonas sp.]|nr:MAG: hypothetical protein COB40_12530 [Marinosulfonomonas sp.]